MDFEDWWSEVGIKEIQSITAIPNQIEMIKELCRKAFNQESIGDYHKVQEGSFT